MKRGSRATDRTTGRRQPSARICRARRETRTAAPRRSPRVGQDTTRAPSALEISMLASVLPLSETTTSPRCRVAAIASSALRMHGPIVGASFRQGMTTESSSSGASEPARRATIEDELLTRVVDRCRHSERASPRQAFADCTAGTGDVTAAATDAMAPAAANAEHRRVPELEVDRPFGWRNRRHPQRPRTRQPEDAVAAHPGGRRTSDAPSHRTPRR